MIKMDSFENDITRLYKTVLELKVPYGYLRLNQETNEIFSLQQEFANLLIENINKLSSDILFKLYLKYNLPLNDIVGLWILVGIQLKRPNDLILEEIKDLYNRLIATGEELIFIPQTIQDIQQLYEIWKRNYISQYEKDAVRAQKVEEVQKELSTITPLESSPLTVGKVILIAKIQDVSTERRLTSLDLPSLFDNLSPKYYMPILVYNQQNVSQEDEFIKVYQTPIFDARPDYSEILSLIHKKPRINAISTIIWSEGEIDGPNSESMEAFKVARASKESFSRMFIGTEESNEIVLNLEIKVEGSSNEIEEILEHSSKLMLSRINQVIGKKYKLVDISRNRISGSFFIYNLQINEFYLADMILNDPILSTYLYIEESQKVFSDRKRIIIHYRSLLGTAEEENPTGKNYVTNPAAVSVMLSQGFSNGSEPFVMAVSNTENKVGSLSKGMPFMFFKVTKGENLRIARQFLSLFKHLMAHYVSEESSIKEYYQIMVPGIITVPSIILPYNKGKITRETSRIDILKALDPEIFVTNYATICQASQQPLPIKKEDISEWTNQTFIHKGKTYHRQVLPFPPPKPGEVAQHNFICPSDETPFPGVHENTLPGQQKYPYLPCCYSEDHIGMEGRVSAYRRYYHGVSEITKATKKAKVGHKIIKQSLLEDGRIGVAPKALEDILLEYLVPGNTGQVTLSRYGLEKSPSTLLESVLIGIREVSYITAKASTRRIVVENFRKGLNQINPAVCLQEMYDYPIESISKVLSDPRVVLDFSLHKRALEVAFGCNIFCIESTPEVPSGNFVFPRFKHFPIWRNVTNKAVIVVQHKDIDYGYLYEPVLIDYADPKYAGNLLKMAQLPSTVVTKMISIQNQAIKTLLFTAIGNDGTFIEDPFKTLNPNIFKPIKQFVDETGKIRALKSLFRVQGVEIQTLIITIPLEPMNLDLMGFEEIATTLTPLSVALSIIGNNIIRSVVIEDGKVVGFWIGVGKIDKGIFFQIIPVDRTTFEQTAKNNIKSIMMSEKPEIIPSEMNLEARSTKLKKDVNFVLSCVKLLTRYSNLSPKEFVNKFSFIDQSLSTLNYYKFKNFPFRIEGNNLNDVLRWIEKIAPTLVVSGKLRFPSDKFKTGIVYETEYFFKTNIGIETERLHYIPNYYAFPTDYAKQNFTVVIRGESNFVRWLSTTIQTHIPLLTRIKHDSLQKPGEPIVVNVQMDGKYLTSNGIVQGVTNKIFLVQSIREGNLQRAMTCSAYWAYHKINTGYDSEQYNGSIPHLLYDLTPAGTIRMIYQETDNNILLSGIFPSILKVEENYFASLLPLE